MANQLDKYFGPNPYEAILKKSDNKNIVNLIKTVETIRFFTFPIFFTFWIIGSALDLIIMLFMSIHFVCESIYRALVNVGYLKLSWFNITAEELHDEYIKLAGIE